MNNFDINPWDQTDDLSGSFNPQPKVYKAKKKLKNIGAGTKVLAWEDGRKELKALFRTQGIIECEIKLAGCKKDNFLGFAHIRRRNTLKPDEIIDPHFVVLACNTPCHEVVDQKMPKKEAEELLDSIVAGRNW